MKIDLNKQYTQEGFIHIPSAIDAQAVAKLRLISEHVLAQWRVCSPLDGETHFDGYCLRHLNHPGYHQKRREWQSDLLEFCARQDILDVVEETLGQKALFYCTSLWFSPLESSNEGGWHRDVQFLHPDLEDEKEVFFKARDQLQETKLSRSMQLMIALVPSSDSEYVPGSHLRWDTPEEFRIRHENDKRDSKTNLMPGARRFHLQPGDIVAFNPDGLHRGRYLAESYRRSLMLTYTSYSAKLDNYFTQQPWFIEEGYLDGLSEHARGFYGEFIREYRENWKALERKCG